MLLLLLLLLLHPADERWCWSGWQGRSHLLEDLVRRERREVHHADPGRESLLLLLLLLLELLHLHLQWQRLLRQHGLGGDHLLLLR